MSTLVRVNLLPREVEERQRGRQITTLTVGIIVLFIALLGVAYVLKLSEIAEAESERATAQAEVTRLQARVAELQEYRRLDERRLARRALLTTAMEREVSWSKVLNDLSLAFPGSASLRTLSANMAAGEDPAPGQIDLGTPVATITYTGYSIERYAPGVEAVLLQLEKVPSFFNGAVTTASVEEIGSTEVTGFNGSVNLDNEALTGRYADGLPPEVAQ